MGADIKTFDVRYFQLPISQVKEEQNRKQKYKYNNII